MKLPRRQFLHLAAGAAALPVVSRIARAQTYPTRPIQMIVGYPAGGPTDALARVLAEELRSRLGQPVVIENRPGANGTAGAVSVVNAAPDGYMLLTTPSAALTVNPYFQKNFPFHPLTALAPITLAVVITVVLAVHPSVPAKNMVELVEYARKNPGKLSYGSPGIGSGPHLVGELLKQKTGIDVAHIPYRGFAPAIQDLVAGHIPIAFGGSTVVLPQAAAGNVRILAVVDDKRAADLPDIPTIAETYPGIAMPFNWFGVFAPAATPKLVIEKLNDALTAALGDPDVIAKLRQQGMIASAEGPAAVARRLQEEVAFYDRFIPSIGIRPE
jgi:tripartite-type tricarboxylate transporter receptor subunit TctC